METLKQVILLTLAVSLAIRVSAVDTSCSRETVQEELHIDIFTEILSNHTELASTFTTAPLIGNMDPNAPAYEFVGSGLHLTDSYLSDTIRARSCVSNEITLLGSVFFKKSDSVGPVLELSYADSLGQSPPVFSLRMDALADEIIVAYRHQGNLHTEVFNARLHTGKWRTYGVTLSGNQVMVYDNCELIHQRVVPLPDYCANDSNLVLSVADSTVQERVQNRMAAFLQNIRFHIGPRGIQRMCPGVPELCPTCGRFLRLVEKVYLLNQEVETLRERVEELERDGVSVNKECSHSVGGETTTFAQGTFMRFPDQTICFCSNGTAQCTDEVCNGTSSEEGDDGGILDPGAPPTQAPVTTQPPFSGCKGEGVIPDLRVSDPPYPLKQDDICRVFTCESGDLGIARREKRYDCASESTCSMNLTDIERIVAQCCRLCTACSFKVCPVGTECELDEQDSPRCVCPKGYRLNTTTDGCDDINECEEISNICPNASQCINTIGSYFCECDPGYSMVRSSNQASFCEDNDECASPSTNDCNGSLICENLPGSYQCVCPEGTALTPSGDCEVIANCDPPCQNGGRCTEEKTCECHPGYKGDRCEEDVNECEEDTHNCRGDNAVCINTKGAFFCRCSSGYMGDGQTCEDIDECSTDQHNCVPEAQCVNIPGSFDCLCSGLTCTGDCRFSYKRDTHNLGNRESMIVGNCRNCTCVDGEVSCVKIQCNCDVNPPRDCCPRCYRKDCVVGSVRIRPGQSWVNPENRCESIFCEQRGSSLVPVTTDLSENCPTLNCPSSLTIQPMGKCCPVCLLQPCTEKNNKQSVSIRNGCQTCTCSNSKWTCQQKVTCPRLACDAKHILFTRDCCPVCASQALNPGQCGT